MSKIIKIETDLAPKAFGPYSQAVIAGGFVYCSGQIGIDPENNHIVPGGIREQTRQAIENIKKVLIAAKSDLNKVVKVEVYLKNMNDFEEMNQMYAQYIGSDKRFPAPARATIGVSKLPKDVLIEISCIAIN